jgi:hypothetical protein
MQDLLKRALLFLVGENYGAKRAPIQMAVCKKNFPAKFGPQQLTHFRIVIDQLPSGVVGVKETRTKPLAQTFGKGGFASGNAAGYADDGARFGHRGWKMCLTRLL